MTYRLDPVVKLIASPIIVAFPNSTTHKYSSGEEVAQAVFDKLYKIRKITADGSLVVLELEEAQIEAVEDPYV